MYFKYSEEEKEYLKKKDKKLGEVIDKIGNIKRKVDHDLFSSIVHHIIGQQISSKAQETIWKRLNDNLSKIDADSILALGEEKIQSFGISSRKTEYIFDFANKIKNNEFDLESIWQKNDEEVIKELSSLKGIGEWTAQMLLLFCMERKNIFSYDDVAIQRGLRMLYRHKKITKPLFEKYKRRYSPYCSIASLYLWEVAQGKIEGLKDPLPIKKKTKTEDKIYYKTTYNSPLGKLTLASDKINLTGLWLEGQKYFESGLYGKAIKDDNLEIFKKTKDWLKRYFNNQKPNINELSLKPKGSAFRLEVWKILTKIPYGKTMTYKEIASITAKKQGKKIMSAQAIGGAIGHNPILIIIPCHRVIGSNNSLTGYAGGIENKIKLLELEGIDTKKLLLP